MKWKYGTAGKALELGMCSGKYLILQAMSASGSSGLEQLYVLAGFGVSGAAANKKAHLAAIQ